MLIHFSLLRCSYCHSHKHFFSLYCALRYIVFIQSLCIFLFQTLSAGISLVSETISTCPNFTSSLTQEVAKNISLPICTPQVRLCHQMNNRWPAQYCSFRANLLTRFPDFVPMSDTSMHFAPCSF